MVSQNIFCSLVVLAYFITFCYGLCDQRPFGGELKCCGPKDSSCYVQLQPNHGHQDDRICYCDSYCKFTNDCCEDSEKVQKLCNQPRDCVVSEWDEWGSCSAKCGFGTMKRTRKVLQYPENGGKTCPALKQTRGCNLNNVCDKFQYATAYILPISFRRPSFGSYYYENILPAEKFSDNEQDLRTKHSPTYSYCVHYKVTFKRRNCEGTWAANLESHMPVCTECQSRVMDGGHCRGEGAIGVRTRWKALRLRRCHGDWIRLGEIIPNCTCSEKQFANFVFV